MKAKTYFFFGLVIAGVICLSCGFKMSRSTADKSLENLLNVQYGENIDTIGTKERMDMNIFFPKGATANKRYPIVMMIHGGGFIKGKKEGLNASCQQLADAGFVAATIGYRMGWSEREVDKGGLGDLFNTQVAAAYRGCQDANAAMRFLISKAAEYAIDTNWIFVGGNSAGAVASLNVAYVTDEYVKENQSKLLNALGGLHNSGNNLKTTYTIKGVCSMWGSLPDSTLINPGSAVPTIFFHGTKDNVIPVDIGYGVLKENQSYGSLCLYRQLRSYNVPAIAHIMPGGKHGPQEYKDGTFAMDNTICFLKDVMKKNAKSGIFYGLDKSCLK